MCLDGYNIKMVEKLTLDNGGLYEYPLDWDIHLAKICKLHFDGMKSIVMYFLKFYSSTDSSIICAETWKKNNNTAQNVKALIECGEYYYLIKFFKDTNISALVFRIEYEIEFKHGLDRWAKSRINKIKNNDMNQIKGSQYGELIEDKCFAVTSIGIAKEQSPYDCILGIEEIIEEDYWRNNDDDNDDDIDLDPTPTPENSNILEPSLS